MFDSEHFTKQESLIWCKTNSTSETDLNCRCVIYEESSASMSSLSSFYNVISKKQERIDVKVFRDYILYFEINNNLI